MAKYTQSIREILQQNKLPSEDLRNISDVYNIAKRSIFAYVPDGITTSTKVLLNYEKPFITGFTLHFFNDELGLETLPLWQIALNEKLVNNDDYMYQIFENLDKQVFADYKVRVNEDTSNLIASLSEAGDMSDSKTLESQKDGTGTFTKEDENTLIKTGNISRAKTGEDELVKAGTIGDSGSYSENATHTGTDVIAKTGDDSMVHTGTIGTARTGADTVTNDLLTENTNLGGQVTDKNNGVTIQYDTPQGSLANMRSPGGDATGTGVAYATNGQSYNYMSAAGENNVTNVHEDLSASQTEDTGTVETAYNSSTTQTNNNTDKTEYNSETTETRDLADGKTGLTGNTRTMNTTDTQSYGSTEQETINTSDVNTDESTETKTTQDIETSTASGEQHSIKSSSNESTKVDNGTVTEYTMNWEMLYRSMPLLNKVWELFDDLFMILL